MPLQPVPLSAVQVRASRAFITLQENHLPRLPPPVQWLPREKPQLCWTKAEDKGTAKHLPAGAFVPLLLSPAEAPGQQRSIEGSSISGLHEGAFLGGISPGIHLGKETQSPSSSSSLLKGTDHRQGFPLLGRSLSAGHVASQACSLQRRAGLVAPHPFHPWRGRQTCPWGQERWGEARTEIVLHKTTRAIWPFHTACPAPKPAGAG